MPAFFFDIVYVKFSNLNVKGQLCIQSFVNIKDWDNY